MITPKQKADEIVGKYWKLVNDYPIDLDDNIEYIYLPPSFAIEAAIIEVDEIIYQWDYIDTYIADLGGKFAQYNLKFWYKVKKEIKSIKTINGERVNEEEK